MKKMKKDNTNNQEIEKTQLEEKNKELQSGWQRCQADFDNYRKRTETQKFEIIERAKADFMIKITPVLDNFGRAFGHLDINDPKIVGLKQIEKQLEDILAQEGLTRISCKGEFNPNLQEAISYEQNSEIPADHIIAECESGWQFGSNVIKPAKVRVSKGN